MDGEVCAGPFGNRPNGSFAFGSQFPLFGGSISQPRHDDMGKPADPV